MKTSIVLTGIVVAGVIGAAAVFSGIVRNPAEGYLSSRGLDESARTVGEADLKLSERIATRLGLREPADPEIDLNNPTERDIRFLIDVFRGGHAAARMSAARALVAAQEPRAVGLLARAAGTPEDVAYFCSGALEILRFKTREEAGVLMMDILQDTEQPISEACRADFEEKARFIRADAPDLLAAYLTSDNLRLRRFALTRMPATDDVRVRTLVQNLVDDRDQTVSRLAGKWLEQPVTSIPSEAGAGTGKAVESTSPSSD